MPENKVSVDLGITNFQSAESAFTGYAKSAKEVAAEASRTAAGIDELERAIEDSFVKSKASATSFSSSFVRSLESAQRAALSLQSTGSGLSGSFFGRVAEDGARVSAEAKELQLRFADLYRQLGEGRPLSELQKELSDAELKLERLRQESFGLQSINLTAKEAAAAYRDEARAIDLDARAVEKLRQELKATEVEASKLQRTLAAQGNAGASRSAADLARSARRGQESLDADPSSAGRVDAFSRGTGASTLSTLKAEAKGFNAEVEKSGSLLSSLNTRIPGLGSPIGSAVRGLFGGLLILDAVRGIVGLVDQYRELKRADEEARRSLIRSSKDVGANVADEIAQVHALKETYHGLSEAILAVVQAEALRANRTPVTQQTILDRAHMTPEQSARLDSLQVPEGALRDAAIAAARERGLKDEKILNEYKDRGIFSNVFRAFAPSLREEDENRITRSTTSAAGKGLADLRAGNTEPLLGISDAEVQARYAGVFKKLPQDFTEEERQTARNVELLRQTAGAYVTAAEAVRRYRDGLAVSKVGPTDEDKQATAEITSLERQQKALEKTQKIRDEFWQHVAESDTRRADEAAKREQEETAREQRLLTVIKTARDTALALVKDVAQIKGRDNPFVALFSEAQAATDSYNQTAAALRQNFGATADALIEKLGQFTKAKRDALAESGAAQRFDDQLDALGLRQEAAGVRSAKPATQGAQASAPADAFTALQTARRASVTVPAAPQYLTAIWGPDSPFAPRSAQQFKALDAYADLTQRQAQGRFVGNPAFALAGEFKQVSEAETQAEFLRSQGSGRIIGDFATAFARPGGGGPAGGASAAVTNAREMAETIRRLEAEQVAGGLDSGTAHRLANEQIVKRVKGSLSAQDLASAPDLRDLVADALEGKADRTAGREQEARQLQADEMKSRKDFADTLKEFATKLKTFEITIKLGKDLESDKALTGASPTAEEITPH